jgi:SAM-dependent methyltransferase
MPDRISFDRVAERYDASRGGDERGREQAAALQPWLPAEGTVLEVGVGTGAVAGPLRAAGIDVVGVDVSVPMLRAAAERVPGRVAAGDALTLPIRSASLAAAYFVHVLHLVPDQAASLAEVARVLRPRGRLLAICGVGGDKRSTMMKRIDDLRGRLGNVRRPDEPDDVAPVAAAGGFVEVHRRELVRPVSYTPAEVARILEDRLWSWTWDIDEETWRREALPFIDELRTSPDADARHDGSDVKSLLVFEKTQPVA